MTVDSQDAPVTVLVVEDNSLALEATSRLIEFLGHKVLAARNGPESLGLLERNGKIDLLISDVVMPSGMTGQQLVDEAQRRHPGIKVALMSAYPRDELVSAGKIDVDTPMLLKPFGQDDLVRMIARLLDT